MILDMGNKSKLFIIYLICLIVLLISACNPIMKAERRVLNDLQSSERVFRELEKTRPCANDTTIITKNDTTTLVDTITNYKTDTININGIEYITIKEAPKTIVKTVTVHKVHTGYIVDTRRLAITLDSVRYYKESLQQSTNTSKKWRGRFWGLLGILIGFILIKRFVWSFLNTLP
jgi:hypothetical protein